MANPNALVDVNEGTSVSNNSPQSPTGSALLETPITLDFDPMSFQLDSPLTSPSDGNREIGDMLSPSQNADVVDFFDPFWPVKEESPTDYYPNVMLGQTSDPLVNTLNEQPQQQFSNGYSDYEVTENVILNESCQDDVVESYNNDDKIIDLSDSVDDGKMEELVDNGRIDYLSESIDNDRIDDLPESVDNGRIDDLPESVDKGRIDELPESVDNGKIGDLPESVENGRFDDLPESLDYGRIDDLPESVDKLDDVVDKLEHSVDRLDLTADSPINTADRLDDTADRFDGIVDQSDEAIDKSEDSVDRSSNAVDRADETLADYCPSSEHSPLPSSKSEITGDDFITEIEQTQSEETCVSPVTEQVFDDNKHDSSEHDQTLDDDLYKRSRTSSSASSQSSKSERCEKRTSYKTTESTYKEDKKITNSVSVKKEKELQKKEILSKKGSVIKTETNGYSSHNGVENGVSLKNSKNEKLDALSPKSPKSPECQTSVTDLMSTYVSLTSQESPLPSSKSKEIISTGIDIKSLKSNYAQNKGDLRGISPDREIISTGIDMKALKSSFIKPREENKYKDSEIIKTGISVKMLKSSFTKTSEETQQSILQEEVKSSVDRVKVQRTFSQSNQDEICLCKTCGKHVYQMEKMKAEKSIFHKNCFRCKECNKLLTVDSYSSNEGDIYCKPHFRQLFQPKARFDGEDAAPNEIESDEGKQRRNEMIIRENVPAELPPDVVRADSKPDHGLENIPVNLSSIKSKFEAYQEEHHLPSTTDVCTLQRSASVMARLAKYQSAVSGGENENGELSESDPEEGEYSEDPTVIKSGKHKEKVVFSGMSSLKSQWETGSVTATKEERMEEKKEELNKLRQRICLGRSESMKAVYEKACQDTTIVGSGRTEPVDLGRDIRATRLKEKFEKGELVNEGEEENLEKVRKEKEEDLSVFTEPGIANDAKKLFKQIDATVKTTTVLTKSPNKSPLNERHVGLQSPVKDADIVRCAEPTEKEEIVVDTTDVTQRFKFFENYSDSPKERKRFQITPPRDPPQEDMPEKDVPRDPNVVRAVDTVDDIPSTDTARRMLDKFKQLEKESPSVPAGPKPLKRITPPREYTKVDDGHDSSPEPERDPNIIRSSYKADEDIIVEADKAKSLRAKFENWENELRENRRNEDEPEEDFLPQVDTAKTLRAKFEAIKEDTLKPIEKPKPKVNRFIQEQTASSMDLCSICNKKVYPMEKMETSGMRLHKNCFRCAHCSCMLRLENYTKSGRRLYCTPHFKQLFISRGNYDEGFGREQHKEKWNRSCNNTTVSRDLHESEDIEYSNGDLQCLEQTA